MDELDFRCSAFWMPGPWGIALPASAATVKIYQNSVFPNERRLIWSGVTAQDGSFSGTTSPWRRSIRVRVGPMEETRPDPTDIRTLTVEIAAAGRSAIFPFPYIAANLPLPSILLPWIPTHLALAIVDGVVFYDPSSFAARCAQLLTESAPVSIELPQRLPPFLHASLSEAVGRLLTQLNELASGGPAAGMATLGASGAYNGVRQGMENVSAGVRTLSTGVAAATIRTVDRSARNTIGHSAAVAGAAITFATGVAAASASPLLTALHQILVAWNVAVPALDAIPGSYAEVKAFLVEKLHAVAGKTFRKMQQSASGLEASLFPLVLKMASVLAAGTVSAWHALLAFVSSAPSPAYLAQWFNALLQAIMVRIGQLMNARSGVVARCHATADRIILSLA